MFRYTSKITPMKTRAFALRGLLQAIFLFCVISGLRAEIRLPQVLDSHMVLQRNQPVKIWGWADKGEKVLVSFNGQEVKARAGKDGRWMLSLEAMEAGGPYVMHIKGKEHSLVLEDILIGDVWICSGQSNMEWPVSNSKDADAEIAAASYPEIRLLNVPKNLQMQPVDDIPEANWQACSPQSVRSFSAVGYFFGRHIHREVGVPIGLIGSNWGGTNVETWTSREMAMNDADMAQAVESITGMDMEAQKAKLEAEREAMMASLGKLEPGMVDGKARWLDEDLDLSAWKPMEVPGLWESKGLKGLDGVVWFRKQIRLTKEQLGGKAVLYLGAIDDGDQTWINGAEVGATRDAYNADRVYEIPAGVLKEGTNTLVIRVEDTGGGGGLWSEPEKLRLWTGAENIPLAGEWLFRVSSEGLQVDIRQSIHPNSKPTLLYNGMIHPLINYAVLGAIWYQGESNAGQAYRYRTRFPNMIQDWRNKWGRLNMGFYFVQLANFMEPVDQPEESAWAELREAQTMTLDLPHTGMAVTIDIGEADDIHPRNKQDVGKRLALAALHGTYGKDVVYSGPVYKSMEVKDGKVRLEMDPMGSKLLVHDKYGYVKGFAMAGEDKQFYWARGTVEGNTLILGSEKVKAPVAIRYAWGNNPDDANVYNAEGLPAGPFRTDEWPGITLGK